MFGVGPKKLLSLSLAAAAVAMFGLAGCGDSGVTEADPAVDVDAGAGEPVCEVVGGAPQRKFECPAGTIWFFNFNPALESPSQNLENYQLDEASRAQVQDVLDTIDIKSSPEQFLAQLAGEIARYYQESSSSLPNTWTLLPDATDSYYLLLSLQDKDLNVEIIWDFNSTACNLGSNNSLVVGGVPAEKILAVQFLFELSPEEQQQPMPPVCFLYPN